MYLSVFLFLQLIFRKVSDVLKEQELAERRKNDPVLNHTQDHLVRKLFSKFKKGDAAPGGSTVGPGSGPSPNSTRLDKDLEKGEVNLATIAKTALNASNKKDGIPEVAVTDVTNSSEPSAPPPAAPVAAPAAPKLKGWARFKGAAAAPPPPAPTPVAPAAPTETTVTKESTAAPTATTLKVKEAVKKEAESEKKQGGVTSGASEKGASSSAVSKKDTETSRLDSAEYKAINDRLNRIENLIADFMVKLEDKTRSIEKSVAKARSSKSKHAKPHSVTICVDSSGNQGQQDSNCDEQYL